MALAYLIEVAERSRIDGSLEGGYTIECSDVHELGEAIAELEDLISEEPITSEYPCHSCEWNVKEVSNV